MSSNFGRENDKIVYTRTVLVAGACIILHGGLRRIKQVAVF